MHNKPRNLIQERDYIVFLPEGVKIAGYDSIPKIAETHARSEREAVSHILFRGDDGLTNNCAKVAMHVLDEKFGGVEKYAVIIPEVTDQDFIDYVLADELAAKNSSRNTCEYLQKARFLLKGVERLPT